MYIYTNNNINEKKNTFSHINCHKKYFQECTLRDIISKRALYNISY